MSRQRAVHLVILAMLSYAMHAQTFRGQLTGTVADPTGAVIPNVEVIVSNLATGVSQKVAALYNGKQSEDRASQSYKRETGGW